jgi:ABC-type uncharacterized transport system permease subunit
MTVLDGFLDSAVRSATPLAFAALGELVAQRSGIINLGVEGCIILGAFAAFAAGLAFGPAAGLAAGGIAGALLALVFAVFVLRFRAQQIIAGAAITMLGLGLAATLHRTLGDPTAPTAHVETFVPLPIPLLSSLPVIGPAFFAQTAATYAVYLLIPVVGFALYRTHAGLALRAVGELPAAAQASGYHPGRVQLIAVTVGGCLAGVGGATLVVAHTGTFSDAMSAGRGFIAIAVVALGRWHPSGVAAGALVFGAASALQFLAQAVGWNVPYNLVLASPYVLTLVALAMFRGTHAAPAWLGRDASDSG